MSSLQPSDTLKTRTFSGLLVAQFLAAFNDQAIHASAMFFAINQHSLTEAQAISLMPILFYAPWAIFCTLAGYLADRYSKRQSLVFWKIAEVAITLIALAGFWLGTHGNALGPFLVLSTVFLMGTHSAFFVPAKYGMMPEILPPHLLSKGNGLLESLSFLAVILGTVFGGVLSFWFRGSEAIIGVILVILALIGAAASFLIRRMPAANPGRPFPSYLYQPLFNNLRTLLRSRPLAFAVLGIAFFTFVVAFMRATVYMHGESRIPRWTEFETSVIVGVVALGIGLGSPLAGFFSGGKIELGLIPLGALGMILAAFLAALCVDRLPGLVVSIVLIGFFTGFYIVPLFTLLQYRAPKTSKGDAIATSNFINVTGAILASLLFFILVFAAQHTGIAPKLEQTDRVTVGELTEDPVYDHGRPRKFVIDVRAVEVDEEDEERVIEVDEDDLIDGFGQPLKKGDEVIESTYEVRGVTHHRLRRAGQELKPVYNNEGLPRLLFLGAGLMTLATLLLLRRQMPDLWLRSVIWLRSLGRYRLRVVGIHNLPSDGPVILATSCGQAEDCLRVLSATDRFARFLLLENGAVERLPALLRYLARRTSLAVIRPDTASPQVWEKALARAIRTLDQGDMIGLPIGGDGAPEQVEKLLHDLQARLPTTVLPVFCATEDTTARTPQVQVVIGQPLPPSAPPVVIGSEIQRLADWIAGLHRDGIAPTTALIPAAAGASPTEPAGGPPRPPSPG